MIKECIRAKCDRQPHEKLSKSSIVTVVHESVKWSNTHSAKGGILTSVASRTVIERRIIDYNEQCVTEPGACALSREEPQLKNDMKKRAENCLYSCFNDSHQAEH